MKRSVLLLIVLASFGDSQINMHAPPEYFKPMVMDIKLRGGIATSNCTKEMINCWELVRPENVCWDSYYFESVCGLMHPRCHTDFKYKHNTYDMAMRDFICPKVSWFRK